MAISRKIEYKDVDSLFLDPLNPRLGRENTGKGVSQPKVLELMDDWNLDELAISFVENGFWPQEALLVTEDQLYGQIHLIVIEGNRRLAALKLLKEAAEGHPQSKKWEELALGLKPQDELFKNVPILKVDSRKDIDTFLGFRHVTGIMEWRPAEKAEYIAKLIEKNHFSYDDVRKKIGSKTEAVRRNYISYRLLRQMEDEEDISIKDVEGRFSVLFLSLRTIGVQTYLHIEIKAEPKDAVRPVPKDRLKALAYFAQWLFGNEEKNIEPLVEDSRQVDAFGQILQSKDAIEYLERTKSPSFEVAYRLAGGDEIEIVRLIENSADSIEAALSRAHLHKNSGALHKAVERLGLDIIPLMQLFPTIKAKVIQDLK